MVGLPRSACLLLLLGTAFAGCLGGAKASTATDPVADVRVAATATTGVIRGIVVDPAIHPLQGVRLSIRLGERTLEANSSATGSFGFEGLPAGTHFIEAHKKGYSTSRSGVEVQAGVSDPPVTKIALAPNPSDRPYIEAFVFKGFLECGVTTPAVGVAVCYAFNLAKENLSADNTQVRYTFGPNLTWLQSEMVWQATNPAGTDLNLWHSYTCPGQTLYCDHGPRGRSPLLVTDNATWIHTLGLDVPGGELYMRVFSAELDGTHPPPPADHVCAPDPALGGEHCVGGAGLALEQDFTIYTHAFHGFAPPAGYRFSGDGEPVVPPI
jgi:hypothetical protein